MVVLDRKDRAARLLDGENAMATGKTIMATNAVCMRKSIIARCAALLKIARIVPWDKDEPAFRSGRSKRSSWSGGQR